MLQSNQWANLQVLAPDSEALRIQKRWLTTHVLGVCAEKGLEFAEDTDFLRLVNASDIMVCTEQC